MPAKSIRPPQPDSTTGATPDVPDTQSPNHVWELRPPRRHAPAGTRSQAALAARRRTPINLCRTRILHLSDTHLDRRDAPNKHGVNATRSLRQMLTDLQHLRALDAIVLSGGIADDGSLEAYVAARDPVRDFAAQRNIPAIYSTGNHDERQAFAKALGSGHLDPDGSDQADALLSSAETERAAVSMADGHRFITLDSASPRSKSPRIRERSASGGTSRETIPNCSIPSPVVPRRWNVSSTVCRAAPEPPSLRTIRRMAQFSEARTVSPAQRTPSSSTSTRTMSSLATPRANQGVLSRRTVPSPRSTAHKPSTLAGGQPPSSTSCRN